MPRKKKSKRSFNFISEIKEETKHGIFAIVLIILAIFFLLARYEMAGIAGDFAYSIFESLFGVGYYLIPVTCLILGIAILKVVKPSLVWTRIVASVFLFFSGLGLVSIISGNEESGGVVGTFMAKPLMTLFDTYVSLALLTGVAIISLLIILDTHLTLERRLFGFNLKRKEKPEDDYADDEDDVNLPIDFDADDEEEDEEFSSDEEEPEEKDVEPEPEPQKESGGFSINPFRRRPTEGDYNPPPVSLLMKDSGKPGAGDIKANSNIIKRTLANFGITVEMDEISIGPSVTRYALKPAEGVKLSRILSLQNDLALALAAHPLRLEAPIPGKSLVGIEIPNSQKTTLGLASLIGSKEFQNTPFPLAISLGKNISGQPFFANLAKAPHMLIAGATGSGKSVTIHTLVTSLLYQNSPDRLRLIMIDPKRVELTLYNKIPHLLTPVITNSKKAIAALRWAANEMDRRYDILEKEAVRDIASYHKNVLEPELAKAAKGGGEDEAEDIERMPYIVIIIDELADIMSAYPRELESAIVRLAQMSRAVGIHLVLSTQRPSVEVITGLIKANVPSRIALQVASQIDSRTIIDQAGAEKLLGAGDMLFISGEMSQPVRLQSAFISENEVKKVVKHLAQNYEEELGDEINLEEGSTGGGLFATSLDADDDEDELYEEAREIIIQAGKASTSYLQRKLKIGYARAARLIDMLEERGVVSEADGSRPREVLEAKPDQTNYEND